MKFKFLFINMILLTSIILFAAACSNDNIKPDETQSSDVISESAPQTADQLRKALIGQWGRLGETMHEFFDDGACIIGGMYGSYEIKDDMSLVTTSEGGTVTVFEWDTPTADNYWQLDGDTLTVNGSSFTRIIEE